MFDFMKFFRSDEPILKKIRFNMETGLFQKFEQLAKKHAKSYILFQRLGDFRDAPYNICTKCGTLHKGVSASWKPDRLPPALKEKIGECNHSNIYEKPSLFCSDLFGKYFLVKFIRCSFCNNLIGSTSLNYYNCPSCGKGYQNKISSSFTEVGFGNDEHYIFILPISIDYKKINEELFTQCFAKGKYFYHTHRLLESQEYLNKALEIKPGHKEITAILDAIRRKR